MNTIVLWVLIGLPMGYKPMVVIERFANRADCEEAHRLLDQHAKCVPMRVYKP